MRTDGTINCGVAGENDEVHDNWVDSVGINIIADYNANDDHIAVIGHTANVYVYHEDVNDDGVEESIINIVSNQHGGGGANAMDLLGQTIVFGDRVEKDDIKTDDNVTYGIVEGQADIAEALFPQGDEKITMVDGEPVKGYDTRTATEGSTMQTNNGLGTSDARPVTSDPYAAFQNDNWSEDMIGAPSNEEEVELTRTPFDQLEEVEVDGQTINGTNGADTLAPEYASPTGMPGALGYWTMAGGADGAFGDERGEMPEIKAYTLYENQAILRTDGATDGPDGTPNSALYFDGEDDFAYMENDPAFQVTQGTISAWIRPDDLDQWSTVISKDGSGTQDGGHFRLGHTNEGGLFLRMAPGDGGGNKAWKTDADLFTEGKWAHVAVSFTNTGVSVYVNGDEINAGEWEAFEGDVASPNNFTEAYMVRNEEPWVFGADSYRAELNDNVQQFATDDEDLQKAFRRRNGGLRHLGRVHPGRCPRCGSGQQPDGQWPARGVDQPIGSTAHDGRR